jgi:hypothetical protein
MVEHTKAIIRGEAPAGRPATADEIAEAIVFRDGSFQFHLWGKTRRRRRTHSYFDMPGEWIVFEIERYDCVKPDDIGRCRDHDQENWDASK